MKIRFHKNFNKQYKKLSKKQKEKVQERLEIFLENPYVSQLNNHPLRGKYTDYRSINATDDLRAVYKYINEQEAIFAALGSHSQLYS